MSKKTVFAIAIIFAITLTRSIRLVAQTVSSQPSIGRDANFGPSDEDMKLFRKDLRSLKKQIIAANMDLTDEEAQQFWPIYDRYTADMTKLMDRKFAIIDEYVKNHDSITDEQADAYIKNRAAVEESILQLRVRYIPLFRKVLPGRTAALFTQIDWRLGLVMDLQLASQVPVIEP